MLICPLCLHENPSDADDCQHCGRYHFGSVSNNPGSTSVDLPQTFVTQTNGPRFGDPNAPAPVMPTLVEAPSAPPASKARLVVIRGSKLNAEFPLYEGSNYLGRTADRPADIDLSGLEPPEQVWSSRQHAVIHLNDGKLSVEDLSSLNGTFVNRARIYPGKRYQLKKDDVVQIGTVQLRVVI
jgi:predicted component of type VI protein secretion system